MSSLNARQVLEAIHSYINSKDDNARSSTGRPVKFGVVDVKYTSGMPRVLFDGETVMSLKGYPWLSPYTPVAGDRVVLIPVGSSYVITGRVVN